MSPDDAYRGLGWKHGALTVQRHARDAGAADLSACRTAGR